MSTSGTFTQFLFDRAIISKQQADVLNSSLRDGDEGRCINAMTDFFSSMSPSDSYDLAFRLFMAWVKAAKTSSIPPSRQDTTEESIHLTPIHSKAASRKVINNQSNSARNKRSTSPTFNEVRSRMNTNSSNNNGNYYSAQSNESVFNKLYHDAHKKNFMLQQYQDHKYATETDECTFQPNSRRSPQRTNGEVFERLQQDLRGFKQQINENKRNEIEMRNCTFSPTINSSSLIDGELSYSSISQTFDRLYNDKKLKELHSYENEVRKQEKEMAGCTFKPVLSPGTLKSYSQLDDSETERFYRLYKTHEEKLKKNEQKVREKSLEESNKYSFKPQRVASPTPGRFKEANKDEKKVVDRLMGWYNDRKKKHDNRVEEQGRKITEDANVSLSTKRRKRDLDETNDSIPAYDRLYKQYSSKKSKNEALEKKVLKEIGASFTPKTNRTRSLSTSSRTKETYHSRAVNNTRPASPVRDMNAYGRKNNSIQYGSVNELIRAK